MARCIELSRTATTQGEHPFACVICKDGEIVAEATNRAAREADVSHHAEMIAMSAAQKALGNAGLRGCTLYSNVEPCAMCSFCIRETRIARVVYSITSPIMGGLSKWNVLGDDELSSILPEVFAEPPEIVAGLLAREAETIWRDWNPLFWTIIRHRGALGGSVPTDAIGHKRQPARNPGLWQKFLSALYH